MRNFFRLYFFGALLLAHLAASDALAATTEVVSVNNQGVPVSSNYYGVAAVPSISADGRYVAFFSQGSFAPEYPATGKFEVYVHDRQTGKTELISKSPTGERSNAWSRFPVLSADGRFVVYYSNASNIVPEAGPGRKLFIHDRATGVTEQVNMPPVGMYLGGDNMYMFGGPQVAVSTDGRFVAYQANLYYSQYGGPPALQGVFVRDRLNSTTEMVSVDENGTQLPGRPALPALSADGRFVVFAFVSDFYSNASILVIRDRLNGTVEQVKCNPVRLAVGAGDGGRVNISSDGRYVSFSSRADYLVPGDTNGQIDIFVYDRFEKTFERVNVATGGEQANDISQQPFISGDGRFVSFSSLATNLVPDDTNGKVDVFIHDRLTGTTERVSVDSDGGQIDGYSGFSPMSADGRFVAFASSSGYRALIYVRDRQTIIANAGNDQVVEQTSPSGAYVTLDGSASKSGCSDAMTYDWTWSGGSANGVNPTVLMPAGKTLVTLKVSACGNSATATVKVTVQDTIKPSTTAALSGNKGLNDWFVSNITVSLSAADSGSGVKEVHYSLDGGAETVIAGSSASFALDTDGVHTVTYYAVDNAGNVEPARTVTAKIDKTPPEVSLSPSLNIIWPPNHKLVDVVINGSASDALSGVVPVDISITDEYGIYNMKAPGFGSVIQLEAWRDGTDMDGRQYKITAVVTDKAGNQATTTTQVLVPHDMRNK